MIHSQPANQQNGSPIEVSEWENILDCIRREPDTSKRREHIKKGLDICIAHPNAHHPKELFDIDFHHYQVLDSVICRQLSELFPLLPEDEQSTIIEIVKHPGYQRVWSSCQASQTSIQKILYSRIDNYFREISEEKNVFLGSYEFSRQLALLYWISDAPVQERIDSWYRSFYQELIQSGQEERFSVAVVGFFSEENPVRLHIPPSIIDGMIQLTLKTQEIGYEFDRLMFYAPTECLRVLTQLAANPKNTQSILALPNKLYRFMFHRFWEQPRSVPFMPEPENYGFLCDCISVCQSLAVHIIENACNAPHFTLSNRTLEAVSSVVTSAALHSRLGRTASRETHEPMKRLLSQFNIEDFALFKVEDTGLNSDWVTASGNWCVPGNMASRCLRRINRLHKIDPTLPRFLAHNFGIRLFARYPMQALLDQVAFSKMDPSDRPPYIKVITSIDDHNGAILKKDSVRTTIHKNSKKQGMCALFYESNGRISALRNIARCVRNFGPIVALIVDWHGSDTELGRTPLDERLPFSENLSNSRRVLYQLSTRYFHRRLSVACYACYSGIQGGFLHRFLLDFPERDRHFTGPNQLADISAPKITIDSDGFPFVVGSWPQGIGATFSLRSSQRALN